MRAELTAASYTGDNSSREEWLRGETAVIRGKLDAPCPTTAPDMQITTATALLKRDGEYIGGCENWGYVPAALGGFDLSEKEQVTALFRRHAQKQHPAEAAAVSAYTRSLVVAASSIDPAAAAPTDRARRVCPADATGAVPSFSYGEVERRSHGVEGGPKLLPDTKVDSDWPGMIRPANLGIDLNPNLAAEDLADAGAHLKNAPKYAIVYTTLGVTRPTYDLPEAPAGYPRQGTLTPGSYSGVIYVVDRVAGKVACAAPLLVKSKGFDFKEKTPDLHRVVQQSFVYEVTDGMRGVLRGMAPGLSDAP